MNLGLVGIAPFTAHVKRAGLAIEFEQGRLDVDDPLPHVHDRAGRHLIEFRVPSVLFDQRFVITDPAAMPELREQSPRDLLAELLDHELAQRGECFLPKQQHSIGAEQQAAGVRREFQHGAEINLGDLHGSGPFCGG